VLDVAVKQPHDDLVLTVSGSRITKVEPRSGSLGYEVVHRRTGDGQVRLDALRCSKRPQGLGAGLYKTAKGLLEVPMPLNYAVSVGVYAASKVLPDAPEDKYWCSRIGQVVSIPFGIHANGRPFLRWSKLPGRKVQRVATTTFQQPCSSVPSCADIYDEIVRLRQPS
jgi:hypothetical protein